MIEAPVTIKAPQKGKLAAIDYAVDVLGIRSFADLGGIGQVFGQYAFYAADKPGVESGVLADLKINDWARAQAASCGLRCVDGDFSKPETIAEIGAVDAVFLFDVLLHTVDPDWDELLARLANSCRCMVIANPQWQKGETVRLLELGRKRFLRAVPPTKNHQEIFDRLDEWSPRFNRPLRDAMHIWQWGITDRDLVDTMTTLGFECVRREPLNAFGGAKGFLNTTFVFDSRRDRPHDHRASDA
jgi:hypothetical protein